MRILAVRRAACYSPNSEDKDAAILQSVSDRLRCEGFEITTVGERQLRHGADADIIISMGRSKRTLSILREREQAGSLVINSTASVALCCNRRRLTAVLRDGGVNVPAETGSHGVWLKRADGTAQTPLDVQFAANETERADAERRMRDAGITDIMTCAHIVGDLVKFYGVCDTNFFSVHYPADDGIWKYSDESINGAAHHYVFDSVAFQQAANKAARLAGLTVYGGDAIVDSDGRITIIDLNDWPSFSRCRQAAAEAIAQVIIHNGAKHCSSTLNP